LQEATDEFLARELEITSYDRFYIPGGGGALAASGRDFIRSHQLRYECRYLIELHGVQRVILLFHGPAAGGPPEAACADYRRKLPWASIEVIRARQERDARELLERRQEWAAETTISVFRAEVGAGKGITFRVIEP
jgi:hypothetical protein